MQAAFLTSKKQIIKEIEEARILWRETLKKLPEQPFSR